MRAVVSVIGKDKKGIIAKITAALLEMDINVEDISQTVMQDYFTMIMLVELEQSKLVFTDIAERLKKVGEAIGVDTRIQSQDIFDAMHRI